MEVKIGILNVARDVIIEVAQSTDDLVASLHEAIDGDGLWQISDEKGRRVVVPTAQIGYVDIGAESVRPVGFGAV